MKSILFKPHLIAQIEKGNKTQTRRDSKIPNDYTYYGHEDGEFYFMNSKREYAKSFKPKYNVGETIYIKEGLRNYHGNVEYTYDRKTAYPGDAMWIWKKDYLSPLFMPRGLARHFLKITNVRVERLKDISEEDAIKEGVEENSFHYLYKNYLTDNDELETARESFRTLWDSINGKDESKTWNANPWVFVYEFMKVVD